MPRKPKSVDTFILPADGETHTIAGFQPGIDHLLFDSGTGVYDGILPPLGYLYDGETFSNSHNTASWTVHIGDFNGDGVLDTSIDWSGGQVFLPSATGLTSADLWGG